MQKQSDKKFFYIIIGCMYLKDDETHLQNCYIKKATSVSNNVFERKLYEGFQHSSHANDFVFLSAPSVGWFPFNCKKIVMKGFSQKNDYVPVNYLTTYLGSTFSKTKSFKANIKKVLTKIDTHQYRICMIINELHLPYLRCAKYIKRKLPESITIQFVPDLPEFNNRSKGFFYNVLKRINCKSITNLRNKYIDKYVLFSNPMVERLGIVEKKNWIVNNGIAPDIYQIPKNFKYPNGEKKHVVFIGKMDERNGIDLILKTANLFLDRSDVVFDFYGIEASDGLSNKSLFNVPNVTIHGFVNPSEVPLILCSADVLLSPRYPDEEYTKFSFPSKLFEYLRAYKPIVTFKLDCYPKELDNLLIYPQSMTVESLFETIQKAFTFQVDVDGVNSFLSKFTKESVVEKVIKLAEKGL